MSLQSFVWAVRMLSLLVLIAFGLLLYFLDPDVAGIYGSILFFVLGSLLLLGFCYLSILGLYRILLGDEQAVHYLGPAARQAVLVLIAAGVILTLIKNNLWYWWSILLVVAFILLLELTLRGLFQKESRE